MSHEQHRKSYTRTHEFVRAFQMDAVCESLRVAIASDIDIAATCRPLLKRIRDDFVATGEGRVIEYVPEVTPDMPLADLYFVAEFLRATVVAFLSPEELDERAPFGLRPRHNGGVT